MTRSTYLRALLWAPGFRAIEKLNGALYGARRALSRSEQEG